MSTSPAPFEPATDLATEISCASISDALDSLGLPRSPHGICALRPCQKAVGPAFTVTYEPADETGGTVGAFLNDVPACAVVLIDNAGRTDCTVWGGIMSETAHERGIADAVINRTCHDVAVAAAAGYPIWSVSRFMRTVRTVSGWPQSRRRSPSTRSPSNSATSPWPTTTALLLSI